jgi:FKBP-type peptidyl-prolyl cis-trans isomerase
MKNILLLCIVAITAAACNTQSGNNIDTTQPTPMSTSIDSVSYILGVNYGGYISGKLKMEEFSDEAFLYALHRTMEGMEPEIDQSASNGIMERYMGALVASQDKDLEAEHAGKKEQSLAWLAKTKEQEGVIELEPGLLYRVIKEGTGEKPQDGMDVTVRYTGKLIDGTIFDSNMNQPEPNTFSVNGLIPGWTKALKAMPVGSKWELFISPDLAYGLRPPGEPIKPNDALYFEVELLSTSLPEAPKQ